MVEEIKSFIIDKLNDLEGNIFYLCDIERILSESENVDGTWTYSAAQAEKEIIDNWDFCGSFYEYYKANFGTTPENPFENPEKFHCQMMIEAVIGAFNYAVNNTENYSSYDVWYDETEITEEFIEEIETALGYLDESDIF